MDPETLSLVIGVAAGTAPIAYGYWLNARPTAKKDQKDSKEERKY